MKVAVVILNYNGVEHIKQFLPTVIRHTQSEDTEIYIADNGSTDLSVEVIKNDFPTVHLIKLEKNFGFAEGYNKALRDIKAEYLMLLNSDVEVTENWLPLLVDYLDKNPDTAACQPKIRSYRKRDYFEHAGASGGFIDKYGFPFCRGRVFAHIEQDNGQYDDIINIFWATGACMLIRSECFNKVGGFDGSFFAHMEEIDLCWRLRSRGYKIACIPQSLVYHVGGATLSYESPFKIYLNFRNSLLMLYKNLPENNIRKILFMRFFFDYAAALQMLVTRQFKNFSMVFKARRDYKKMRPDCMDNRKENLLHTTIYTIPEVYQKSTVIQYFLKGKKTFALLMKDYLHRDS